MNDPAKTTLDILVNLGEVCGVVIALATFMWSVWVTHLTSIKEHRDRALTLEQSKRDLRWRQTVEAQSTIRRLTDDTDAKNAMTILDYDGCYLKMNNGLTQFITWDMMRISLRTASEEFSVLDTFVRSSFDSLFDKFEMIQQQIDNGLFQGKDVKYPLEYYSNRMTLT